MAIIVGQRRFSLRSNYKDRILQSSSNATESIHLTTTVKIADNALMQKVSDELVILDSISGQYYTLNETATNMLEQLKSGKTVEQTIAYMCSEYNVEEQEVHIDVSDMINNLLNKELIILDTSSSAN